MILADDNFATIVRAVEEGRVIYENIKKAVFFLLSCNAGEIITIFAAILLGWPLPLSLIHILESDCNRGLTHVQVEQRRKQYGFNELEEQKGITIWGMFLNQFKEFLVLLLIAAAAVSLAIRETTDAVVILAVVLLNAVLGVIQEYKAEKSLAALKTLSAPTAKVVRESAVLEIPARELVPGDLILLEAGDYIPADARLVEAANLGVDESALTGESVPVEKNTALISTAVSYTHLSMQALQ